MRTPKLLPRFLWIALVFSTVLPRYLWRRVAAGRSTPAERERLRGEVLADTLQRLGATFVKFGQILGSRPDLLGPGYVDALARLQDAVPPAPFETVERVLDGELTATERARIAHVEREPIAAASVAQVHAGRLADGARVALKVQRPAARSQIERDLAILSIGARVLDWIPSLHLLSLPGAVERFGEALSNQIDFRLEAANNRRLAANFADLRGVRVPELHEDLCTERLLVMELIEGTKATHPERVRGRKARRRLAARGAEAILQMVFVDGFVHADMHPGNILLMDDGTLVFIDLGMVAEIPPDLMRPWIDTFQALGGNDGRAAARLFYAYAPTVGTRDYGAYERDTEAFFDRFQGKRLGEVEVGEVVGGMMNILRRHRVQVDPVFTVVNLGVLVAEGLGKQLDPDIDLVQMAMPYLAKAAARAPEGRPPRREPPA
ncbi:MAG TPA: AarF/UbiB family protein [Sandaracinaceae bacterium LLY-WYZ-13_1]|nr:AarF/UbiB family protein [Sandaracinaceae bacterium LLY-WYZ-13_1]